MNSLEPEVIQITAIEAISRAEINQSIATARQYARILPQVKQKMLNFACLDEETAESCFYSLPRGGKTIQGPSVRLAEIAVCCYGNLRAGTRIIETVTTGDSPHVTIQAVAMDLESNVSITIEKRRRIIGKKSAGGAISEDDINLAANAGSAIAFRDAVFKIVPLALIKPVYEAAKKVAIGDAKSLGDRRARCIDSFGKMGISKDRILAKLEKKSLEEIGLEDLESLIGLYTAIKDGELTIDEAFPAPKASDTAKPSSSAPAPVNLAPKPAAAPTQPAEAKTATGGGKATGAAAAPEPEKAPVAAPTQPVQASEPAKAPSTPPETDAAAPGEPAGEPANEPATPETQGTVAPQEPASGAAAPVIVEIMPKDAPEALEFVNAFAARDGVSPDQIMRYLLSVKLAKSAKNLSEVSFAALKTIAVNWDKPVVNGKTICEIIKGMSAPA